MADDPVMSAKRIRITGLVQGIGYRAWAASAASRLGIEGWVRNRIDGSVEILAVGPAGKVAELVELCRTGPRLARVESVQTETTPGIVAHGFTQKPTV